MSGGGLHLKDEGSKQQVVLAGATAGLVSRFCIAPLDVIKIRLQLHSGSVNSRIPAESSGSQGTIATFKSILSDEGIRGFWKGNVPAELLYITYGSLQFTTYRFANQTLRKLSENHPLPAGVESFISGACAGAVATSMTYPLDLLRTRFAAQGVDKVYNNLLDSVRQILKSEGPQGFFHGLSAGVGQIVPYMGLFFSTYETLRPPLAHMSLPFGSGDAAAGVLAGTIAKTGVFPLDLIRKRLQVQGPSRQRFANGMVPLYGRGMLNAGKAIVGKEGWRGLYRGLGIGLIKAAPASAVTMWTYERVLRQLRRHKIGEWA